MTRDRAYRTSAQYRCEGRCGLFKTQNAFAYLPNPESSSGRRKRDKICKQCRKPVDPEAHSVTPEYTPAQLRMIEDAWARMRADREAAGNV